MSKILTLLNFRKKDSFEGDAIKASNTTTTAPSPNTKTTEASPINYHYNPLGQLSQKTDGNGNQTHYHYNPNGQGISTQDPNGKLQSETKHQTQINYHHNAENRLSQINTNKEGLLSQGQEVRYHYDPLGRRSRTSGSYYHQGQQRNRPL